MDLDERKTQIMKAAQNIVAERGVANTTLQAIADEAGISKGSLYYHYNSKSAILYDLMDYSSSRAKTLATYLKVQNMTKEEIAAATKEIFKITAAETPASRLFIHLVYEAILGDEELRSKFNDKYEQWITNIEEILLTLNDIPKTENTRLMAILVEAAIDGFILKNLLGIQVKENKQVLEILGDLDLEKIGLLFNKN